MNGMGDWEAVFLAYFCYINCYIYKVLTVNGVEGELGSSVHLATVC